MFDHYVAVDWSQKTMAIARMTKKSNEAKVWEVPTNIGELKIYLKSLKGSRVLTVEESSPAQWLFTELRDSVDEIIVCDPYRNHLLNEGAKNDKIDAEKLCRLLKGGLLKPVFHNGEEMFHLRKMVSGYIDVVKTGVRFKNQRKALFRAHGGTSEDSLSHPAESFVLSGLERGIEYYLAEKKRYSSAFEDLCKKHPEVRLLMSLPGIGVINAIKIAATVVDPERFASSGHFLSYSGLIKLEKMSGGKSYGHRTPRYSRLLKGVFQNAALTALNDKKQPAMRELYRYLIDEKKYPDWQAKHFIARKLAVLSLGILKSGEKFNPRRRKNALTV